MGNVDVWSKILFTFDHQSWNSTTQLTVLGSKHYVKRLLAIFHSPYFFRVPSSSPRFYVKNLLSFMSPIWNKIIWKVSRVGSNRRLFTKVEIFLEQREVAFLNYFYFTGKHKENYRKQIYSLDGHVSIQFGVVVQLFTYKMVDNTMEFLLRTGVLLTVL